MHSPPGERATHQTKDRGNFNPLRCTRPGVVVQGLGPARVIKSNLYSFLFINLFAAGYGYMVIMFEVLQSPAWWCRPTGRRCPARPPPGRMHVQHAECCTCSMLYLMPHKARSLKARAARIAGVEKPPPCSPLSAGPALQRRRVVQQRVAARLQRCSVRACVRACGGGRASTALLPVSSSSPTCLLLVSDSASDSPRLLQPTPPPPPPSASLSPRLLCCLWQLQALRSLTAAPAAWPPPVSRLLLSLTAAPAPRREGRVQRPLCCGARATLERAPRGGVKGRPVSALLDHAPLKRPGPYLGPGVCARAALLDLRREVAAGSRFQGGTGGLTVSPAASR